MSSRLLATVLMFVATFAVAEDSPTAPSIVLTSSYNLIMQEIPGSHWNADQHATLGFSARWGSVLKFRGVVDDPLADTPTTANNLLTEMEITWIPNDHTIVTFGKQRLNWGTARQLQAIDCLEPIYDPANPTAVLNGVAGIRLELLPYSWLSFSSLILPLADLNNSKVAARADVLWLDTDFSVGAVRAVDANPDHCALFGNFARFFDQFGVYGELQLANYRDRDWSFTGGGKTLGLVSPNETCTLDTALGIEVDFAAWLNGTIRWTSEYHYNGEGFSESEANVFNSAYTQSDVGSLRVPPALANGGVGVFSKQYGFTGVTGVPVTPKLSLYGSVLAGLDTGFWMGNLGAAYQVDQTFVVKVDYTHFDALSGVSELVLIPQRNQCRLVVTGSF